MVSVEADGERDRVHVTRLDAVEEPESVPKLRAAVRDLLPAVDLPEVLIEVDGWTAFTDAFTHVSGARARVPDLALSVCGVLLAQACNVGYGPVSRRDIPALTPARLEWVTANFVRAETIRAANDRLLAYHQTIGLTRRWGAGELASADGLRFVVPVRSVHFGPNPRYFGTGRGVTYYNWTSDQHAGFAAIVITGTLRNSQFILDGLLDNDSVIRPGPSPPTPRPTPMWCTAYSGSSATSSPLASPTCPTGVTGGSTPALTTDRSIGWPATASALA